MNKSVLLRRAVTRDGKKLDSQMCRWRQTNSTIVIYGTDNGAETGTWPDGGTTRYHGEKATGTTWEGGFRVPCVVRWPGVIKPGTQINDIMSQEDWMPTLLPAAGEPDMVEELEQAQAGGKSQGASPDGSDSCRSFKVGPRRFPAPRIYYFGQGGELNARPLEHWKVHFAVPTGTSPLPSGTYRAGP